MPWLWRKYLLPKPPQNSIFNCHNPKGIKLLRKLRLGVSYLCDQKFNHSFQDLLNLICNCGTEIEATPDYLFHCPTLSDKRLIVNLWIILDFQKCLYLVTLPLTIQKNTFILNTSTEYTISSKIFGVPLFDFRSV